MMTIRKSANVRQPVFRRPSHRLESIAEGRQIFRVDTFGEEKEFQPPTLAASFKIEHLRREENHACDVAQECSILDIFFRLQSSYFFLTRKVRYDHS
jgi:hypothetical protein